jgi:hypothetical protein
MLNFVYLRSYRLHFFWFLSWFKHCQQGREVWACFVLLNAFREFSSGFEPFLGFVGHWSDRSRSPVWPVCVLALVQMLGTDLTSVVDRSEQGWCSCSILWSGRLYSFSGSLHVCRRSSLWFSCFALVVCALCLSLLLSRLCRAVALA